MKNYKNFIFAIFSFCILSMQVVAAEVVAPFSEGGTRACLACHDEESEAPILSIYHTAHGVVGDDRSPMGAQGCESCHGPSAGHANSPLKVAPATNFGPKNISPASERANACLGCHQDTNRSHWASSTHQQEDIACNDCHRTLVKQDPMLDDRQQAEQCFNCHKIQQAKLNLPSTHPIKEGKTVCSDCHNPHGSGTDADLKKVSLNELCLGCHQEKRGPFLFEHPPVAEDCSECHEPHGSAHPSLLISRPPLLCQRCHMTAFHPSTLNDGSGLAAAIPNNRLLGKSCLNCHGTIHGSNHPSGARFTR